MSFPISLALLAALIHKGVRKRVTKNPTTKQIKSNGFIIINNLISPALFLNLMDDCCFTDCRTPFGSL